MLEEPDFDTGTIRNCLKNEYGIDAHSIQFLPLGADPNTVVYRGEGSAGLSYFVKLRRGNFVVGSVTVPKYLGNLGFKQIIAPIQTVKGELWTELTPFLLTVYPYVEGKNGFERELSNGQRMELGEALRQFHNMDFPEAVVSGIDQESFSSRWRDRLSYFLSQITSTEYKEPIAAELALFLMANRQLTNELISRATALAAELQLNTPEFILCHADFHGWNLLLDDAGNLFIIDWDTLILAPKERDLMFVGTGLGGRGQSREDEVRLFYEGYGNTAINERALAYYRYERIIEDIAVSCEMLLLSDAGGDDRRQALIDVKTNYLPGRTIDFAYKLDKSRD